MRDSARTIGVLRAMAGKVQWQCAAGAKWLELTQHASAHSLPLPSVCAHTMHSAHVHVIPHRSSAATVSANAQQVRHSSNAATAQGSKCNERSKGKGNTVRIDYLLVACIWLLLSYMAAAAVMDEE